MFVELACKRGENPALDIALQGQMNRFEKEEIQKRRKQ